MHRNRAHQGAATSRICDAARLVLRRCSDHSCARVAVRCALMLAPRSGKFASLEPAHVVGENLRVIERERSRRIARIAERGVLRVIGAPRRPRCARDVDHRDRLAARIPIRPRIHAKQRAKLDLERYLLARLAHCGLLDGLAKIDEAAGNRPAQREILTLDQNYFVANLGDYVGGYRRTFRAWHDAILTWR